MGSRQIDERSFLKTFPTEIEHGQLHLWRTVEAMHQMRHDSVRTQQPGWRLQERDAAPAGWKMSTLRRLGEEHLMALPWICHTGMGERWSPIPLTCHLPI